MTEICCTIRVGTGTRNPISEGMSALLKLLAEVEAEITTCGAPEETLQIHEIRRGQFAKVKLDVTNVGGGF